ncbi:MAG: YjjG family noncanonical pyrimidine nucleotidase [Chitinophagaceae bacterium]
MPVPIMKYNHLFFDLDHTLWDFDANSRLTLEEIYLTYRLEEKGVNSFERFYLNYLAHNEKLWARYRAGTIKSEELRWKRMALTLLDFRIGDEPLAKQMGTTFLDELPNRNLLFADAIETLQYLKDKGYLLHLVTNGFELIQHSKLRNSGLDRFFIEVITSESSNSLKPNKEIFHYAFNKTSALPEQSIMIGDSIEADIQGAMNAGIDQVFVNHLNIKTEVVPTFTVYSLQELQEIF